LLFFGDEPEHWCEESSQLHTKQGRVLGAQLLIGADGVHSWVRSMMGIEVDRDEAIDDQAWVGYFNHQNPHLDSARQKFYPEGVIGVLPTCHPRKSVVVWSQNQNYGQNMSHSEKQESMQSILRAFFRV
jgi:2-octaprenylphenol hydroxylase